MEKLVRYDVFLTHAWRYHEPWSDLAARLDADRTRWWRNFSLPWHDPAIDPRSDKGRERLIANMESQIAPVDVVLLILAVYAVPSAQKWMSDEIDMARKRNIPIIGVMSRSDEVIPELLKPVCREFVLTDLDALAMAIDRVRSPT